MTNACSLTNPSPTPAKALCKCLFFKLLEMCPVPWFDNFLLLGLFSLRLEATKNVKHPAYEIYKTYTKHTLMWTCIPYFLWSFWHPTTLKEDVSTQGTPFLQVDPYRAIVWLVPQCIEKNIEMIQENSSWISQIFIISNTSVTGNWCGGFLCQ